MELAEGPNPYATDFAATRVGWKGIRHMSAPTHCLQNSKFLLLK